MDAPSIQDLKRETDNFFRRHWVTAEIGANPPEWKASPTSGPGSSIQNYSKGGTYALLQGETVAYIGVGTSKGADRYPEHGIARRLLGHVIGPCSTGYTLKPKWQEATITAILTIGFDQEQTHIALALENYLIGKLRPLRNTRK